MPLVLQHVAEVTTKDMWLTDVADGRHAGVQSKAPSVKTRQGSKSPFGGRFGDTIITCTCPQTFGNTRFWNVQRPKPAGRASTGRHRRPGERGAVPARGGSRLRLPVPATSGGEAEAWPRSPPAPRPPRGVPPASRGPGPQTQARKASVRLPAPRSGCRRCRRRAAHPRCQEVPFEWCCIQPSDLGDDRSSNVKR
ncbi:hypothetical protein GH733_014413, partial [Mirounga leonina]